MVFGDDPRLLPAFRSGVEKFFYVKPPPKVPKLLTKHALHSVFGLVERFQLHSFGKMIKGQAGFPELEQSEAVATGVDGNPVKLYISRPKDAPQDLPCILHLHGGGMCTMSATSPHYVWVRHALADQGLVVVGVEFRNASGKLGPFPFPAGLNDCYGALRWTHDNLGRLGASKIVVSGDSGGGNLSLATALKAKKEGETHLIAGVYALCPFIAGPEVWSVRGTLSLWENEDYLLPHDGFVESGRLYDPEAKHNLNPLCWPFVASPSDLHGLPPHVISANELDPLRDEGLEYARRLASSGVPGYTRVLQGTPHGMDIFPLNEGCMPQLRSTMRDIASFAKSL